MDSVKLIRSPLKPRVLIPQVLLSVILQVFFQLIQYALSISVLVPHLRKPNTLTTLGIQRQENRRQEAILSNHFLVVAKFPRVLN